MTWQMPPIVQFTTQARPHTTRARTMSALSASFRIAASPVVSSSRRAGSSSRRAAAPARASAGSDEKKVSSGRREAVAAAVLAAAALSQAAPALARGLPEFECTGEVTTGASGLQFCESVVGSGITPSKGSLIKAHYTGRLLDGRVFDSSYSRGSPLTFKVGVREVIAGWDEGILGGEGVPPMKVGGKRVLTIPANLAYGSRGAGGGLIPPDATLKFDVELVQVL
ncbi:peptidyl prolyl isomerase [Micromonas commoda]|uniref:peptidylprolyl isomerase n=1 Tax=Micromonas commoda (strain RCC299 / NOUM17 / CCMP2709) TaxID=296587 RepID=C1E8D3_MICCC|nr:peptidyl prolyl isomerase [Micromonas commoda]ACO64493.1 peptidyl prolyl isomerase [Micromonas commoda]|eukprot:XP_002503235.1 peptidyl prolyl isomerase [Micromonas commoda]